MKDWLLLDNLLAGVKVSQRANFHPFFLRINTLFV